MTWIPSTLVKSVICLAVFALGCGARQPEQPVQAEEAPAVAEVDAPESPSLPRPEPAVPSSAEGISREDLDRALAAGPAALLAEVRTEPVFEQGRFVGFKIAAFVNEPPTVIDLRVNDVILSVNGRKVERPEDYFEVFRALEKADELSFEVLRGGEKKTLRYPIQDIH
jgi:type II secretory pathway component PulC